MLSQTSEYALRAMIHLAQHEDEWPIPVKIIAAKTGIPPKYLSKILGDLARAGVLSATRGKLGGFRMVQSPQRTMLLEVMAPFERFEHRRCPFRNKECDESDPCLAHDRWKHVVEAYQGFLGRNSVSAVSIKKSRVPSRRTKRRTKPSKKLPSKSR